MKKIFILFLIFTFLAGSSQKLKPIAQKVYDYSIQNKSFNRYDLFTTESLDSKKVEQYSKAAENISVFRVRPEQLSSILSAKPSAMEISFPFEGKTIVVELVKNNIFTDDFKAKTQDGKTIDNSYGGFYQGIVKGDYTSIAAISFFENEVMGVISIAEVGNIVLGKAKDSNDYVSYNDVKLKEKFLFSCGANELPENQQQKISFDPKAQSITETQNCVRIYYEATYNVLKLHNYDKAAVTRWITGMFNNVQTLYRNDGIKIALSQIYIWSTQDPYDAPTYEGVLGQFALLHQPYNGDVAQLLYYPSIRSVGWVNQLCDKRYQFSMAGMKDTYETVPTFSWNVDLMAHELGHNLGSPHTHACAWNGNETAIDGCEIVEGNCPTPPIPEGGGTIMSYCTNYSVGINFTKGFGPQPSALIRNIVDKRSCLGTNCTTSCENTVLGLSINTVTRNSISGSFTDNVSTSWKYSLTKFDGTVVNSGHITQKTLDFSGLTPNTYYALNVGTDCSGSNAYQRSAIILTEDAWCGKTFTDTGGVSGNYEVEQNYFKTFYPDRPGQKVTLTFNDFAMAKDGDYLDVNNGSHSQRLNAETPPTTPFVSDRPDGSISIHFESNKNVTQRGWEATISCTTLSVIDDPNANEGVVVYPNPFKNTLFIVSKELVESYGLSDISGRVLVTDLKIYAKEFHIDLSSLETGTYFINFALLGKKVSKKIIKQ